MLFFSALVSPSICLKKIAFAFNNEVLHSTSFSLMAAALSWSVFAIPASPFVR
jgi:hypothetical protein